MAIVLPPPPDISNHPLVDDDKTMTQAYAQWFFNIYNILIQSQLGAPGAATYIINTTNSLLSNAQVLANLQTGFALVNNGSGLITTQAKIKSTDTTIVDAVAYTYFGGL